MNAMDTYTRVIPRDFFNEAKLLKCLGIVALKVLDGQLPKGIKIEIEETGEPFQIVLSKDGMLYVENYPVSVNGRPVTLCTVYNSKAPYPLYCCTSDDGDQVQVLDELSDHGDFTSEFIERFSA